MWPRITKTDEGKTNERGEEAKTDDRRASRHHAQANRWRSIAKQTVAKAMKNSTNYEAGKTMDRIESRRRKRGAKDGTSNNNEQNPGKKARKFRQNRPATDDTSDHAASKAVLKSLV